MGVHTGEPELSAGGYYVGVDLTRGGADLRRRTRGSGRALAGDP